MWSVSSGELRCDQLQDDSSPCKQARPLLALFTETPDPGKLKVISQWETPTPPKVIVVKSRQNPNYPDLYEGYYEIEHVCWLWVIWQMFWVISFRGLTTWMFWCTWTCGGSRPCDLNFYELNDVPIIWHILKTMLFVFTIIIIHCQNSRWQDDDDIINNIIVIIIRVVSGDVWLEWLVDE